MVMWLGHTARVRVRVRVKLAGWNEFEFEPNSCLNFENNLKIIHH